MYKGYSLVFPWTGVETETEILRAIEFGYEELKIHKNPLYWKIKFHKDTYSRDSPSKTLRKYKKEMMRRVERNEVRELISQVLSKEGVEKPCEITIGPFHKEERAVYKENVFLVIDMNGNAFYISFFIVGKRFPLKN